MEKDVISYKEVLLSLRKEYLKIEEEIEELKKYVEILDNNINYYDFRFYPEYKRNIDANLGKHMLVCYIDEKQTKKDKILCRIKFLLRFPIDTSEFAKEVLSDENNNYYIDDKQSKIKVNEENQDEFNKAVEKIMQGEFVNNIGSVWKVKDSNFQGQKTPHINFACPIGFYGIKDHPKKLLLNSFYIGYDQIRDEICVKSSELITEDEMIETLNLTIPKKEFPAYELSVFEKNKSNEKEIKIIADFDEINNKKDDSKDYDAKFIIEETPEQLIFRQKQRVRK